MLRIVEGNILNASVEAVVNPVNTVGVMGKGLALQFKNTFPIMFKEYVRICKSKEFYVGRLYIHEPKDRFKYIINFPTKVDWRNDSKLEYIKIGLELLVYKIDQLSIKSIAIPALGCNNGNLKWDDVLSLMIEILFETYQDSKIEIYIYKPLD